MLTPTPYSETSAAVALTRVRALRAEHAAAALEGLTSNATYMADLLEDIAGAEAAYIGSAVTEIASMRALLDGPQVG
jgi:hypothetical protein